MCVQFDLDDSGEIETKELMRLGQARRKLGQKSGAWSHEKNAKLVKNMDTDGDGTVNEKEFATYFARSLPTDRNDFDEIISQFMDVAQETGRDGGDDEAKWAEREARAKAAHAKKLEDKDANSDSPTVVRPKGGEDKWAEREANVKAKQQEKDDVAHLKLMEGVKSPEVDEAELAKREAKAKAKKAEREANEAKVAKRDQDDEAKWAEREAKAKAKIAEAQRQKDVELEALDGIKSPEVDEAKWAEREENAKAKAKAQHDAELEKDASDSKAAEAERFILRHNALCDVFRQVSSAAVICVRAES